MSTWNDFNNADDQQSYDLIPKGTLAKVRMTIRPGGYDDSSEGWTGGYATYNDKTGSVYLNCEFVVTEGPYARRKVWSLIGLHSPKGPEWAHMGRSFIKSILNSARGVHPSDETPQAQNARRIGGLADLDGIEFVAKIDLEKVIGPVLIRKWFSKGKEKRIMAGTKAWWQSRAVWGGLVAAVAGIGGLFGLNLDEVSQGMVVDVAVQMATVAGALFAVIGRVRATKKIG